MFAAALKAVAYGQQWAVVGRVLKVHTSAACCCVYRALGSAPAATKIGTVLTCGRKSSSMRSPAAGEGRPLKGLCTTNETSRNIAAADSRG